MTKIIQFPERRDTIPVNLPDIGCAQAIWCPRCGLKHMTVMGVEKTPGEISIVEIVCPNVECDYRADVQ